MKNADLTVNPAAPLELEGIEPSSPRCDRGVLPLYDSPGKGLIPLEFYHHCPIFTMFICGILMLDFHIETAILLAREKPEFSI